MAFSQCRTFTSALQSLSHATSLVHVDVSGSKIQDEDVATLFSSSVLTRLNLRGCRRITDRAFLPLQGGNGSQLEAVDISRCDHITDETFERLAACTELTTVIAAKCNKIGDGALWNIRKCSLLRTVDVSWNQSLTDRGVQALTHLPWLAHINISRCPNLTDVSVVALSRLARLATLDVSRNQLITDNSLEAFIEPVRETLERQAQVRAALETTRAQLDYMIRGGEVADRIPIEVGQMKEIELEKTLEELTVSEISALEASVLHTVNVSFCIKVTDRGIEAVTRLPMITSLSMEHCPEVTDVSASAAARCHGLRVFNAAHCPNMTYHSVDCLAKCDQLEVLDLSYCPKLNVDTVELLKESRHAIMARGVVKLHGCVQRESDALKEEVLRDDPWQTRQNTYESYSVMQSHDTAGVWHFDDRHFGFRDVASIHSCDDSHHTTDMDGISLKNLRAPHAPRQVRPVLSYDGVFAGQAVTHHGH